MNQRCAIAGCSRKHNARGWCLLHYKRWKRTGDPNLVTVAPKGAGYLKPDGYRIHCIGGKDFREHRMIAEKALGKPLPPGVEVHHLDGGKENRDGNLIIVPDRAYHMLLHQRMRARAACGNPNWRKCLFCKQYGDPSVMRLYSQGSYFHQDCRSKYRQTRRALGFKSS